jgi:Uncharacterised protein family UPF0547
MILALILFLLGIVCIATIPLLGWIPGLLLIIVAFLVFVFALLGRGIGAIAGIGSEKVCPECRSKIPADATVCRYCGYRYTPE